MTGPDRDLARRLTEQSLSQDVGARATPTPIGSLDDLRKQNLRQDIELKKTYANWTLRGVAVQLGIADAAFWYYLALAGRRMSPVVMDIWLSATVVQVIGIIFVITRYLFPRRDDAGDTAQPSK